MIQRIQTIYLMLSAIVMAVCMCCELAVFEPLQDGATLTNLRLVDTAGNSNYAVAGLIAILLATALRSILNIFNYNDRKKQSRQCLLNIILCLLWYVLFLALTLILSPENTQFTVLWPVSLPGIAIIFQYLAYRGIKADEKLLRDSDRMWTRK